MHSEVKSIQLLAKFRRWWALKGEHSVNLDDRGFSENEGPDTRVSNSHLGEIVVYDKLGGLFQNKLICHSAFYYMNMINGTKWMTRSWKITPLSDF